MSALGPTWNCPSCGAPVTFVSAAPFAVCGYCNSLLVRRDANLEDIGKVAQVLDDSTPFQVGTSGIFEGRSFTLVGRLQKFWADGSWNEWCAAFDGQRFGWLAEAQGDLVMTFAHGPASEAAPELHELRLGVSCPIDGKSFEVTDVIAVTSMSAQGELARGDIAQMPLTCADLRGGGLTFATWEVSGNRAQLFTGRFVEFPECRFRNLRTLEGWGAPGAATNAT